MGGDKPPKALYSDLLKKLESLPFAVHLTFFGSREVAEFNQEIHGDCTVNGYVTDGVIHMNDAPKAALKEKANASLPVAIRMLKLGEIDAVISNGNTGALAMLATMELEKIPGIDRPVLLADIPTRRGMVSLLDVGASHTPKRKHLVQSALMAYGYHLCLGTLRPKVALYNIGKEENKGRPEEKAAYEKLKELSAHISPDEDFFIGNAESGDLLEGNAHAFVTDGYTGNTLLKTIEATSQTIFKGLISLGIDPKRIEEFNRSIHNDNYTPGALLIGLQQPIFKCHGKCGTEAVLHALYQAHTLLKSDFSRQLTTLIATYHTQD